MTNATSTRAIGYSDGALDLLLGRFSGAYDLRDAWAIRHDIQFVRWQVDRVAGGAEVPVAQRDGFAGAVLLVISGEADCIVVRSLADLGVDQSGTCRMLSSLREHGIRVISVDDDFDSFSADPADYPAFVGTARSTVDAAVTAVIAEARERAAHDQAGDRDRVATPTLLERLTAFQGDRLVLYTNILPSHASKFGYKTLAANRLEQMRAWVAEANTLCAHPLRIVVEVVDRHSSYVLPSIRAGINRLSSMPGSFDHILFYAEEDFDEFWDVLGMLGMRPATVAAAYRFAFEGNCRASLPRMDADAAAPTNRVPAETGE